MNRRIRALAAFTEFCGGRMVVFNAPKGDFAGTVDEVPEARAKQRVEAGQAEYVKAAGAATGATAAPRTSPSAARKPKRTRNAGGSKAKKPAAAKVTSPKAEKPAASSSDAPVD